MMIGKNVISSLMYATALLQAVPVCIEPQTSTIVPIAQALIGEPVMNIGSQ
jgi:hypothetical protein